MNARIYIDGSFRAMRLALDNAEREFASGGATDHRDALQRFGRAMMTSIAEIIVTDGGSDGYLYDADGISQDIESGYHKLIEQEEIDDLESTSRQSSHETLNFRKQGIGR